MPIGVLTDNLMVVAGGILGGIIGTRIPERIKVRLNQVFGFAALGIGVTLIVRVHTLGAVVLALILGALFGTVLHLDDSVSRFFAGLNARILKSARPDEEYMSQFTVLLVLCCCSGTGIFGSMNEGLSGDSTTILCKAVLDFFTVMIFATVLGKFCAVIALPQMIILLGFYFCARLIVPVMTDSLTGDFSAVGGFIELMIGMRILKLSEIQTVDALPALLLIFPISALWNMVF